MEDFQFLNFVGVEKMRSPHLLLPVAQCKLTHHCMYRISRC